VIARVDGKVVSPEVLWWPAMNYDQFRWDYRLGGYELELPRAEFVKRLEPPYQECVAELRADDLIEPEWDTQLRNSGYPPLEVLMTFPETFCRVVKVFLWDEVFAVFLPCPEGAGKFMVNSIDEAWASPSLVFVRGRGYHARPGLGTLA
jgi:hypothetical protein